MGGTGETNESQRSHTDQSDTGSVKKKRGPGRPPSTGGYVGLAAAKAAVIEKEREALQLRAKRELLDSMAEARVTRAAAVQRLSDGDGAYLTDTGEGAASLLVSDLMTCVESQVGVINRVATRSSNPKGTFKRALTDAAEAISSTMKELSVRTVSEDVLGLRTDNTALRAKVASLSVEVTHLSADLEATKREMRARDTLSRPVFPIIEVEALDGHGQASMPPPTTSPTASADQICIGWIGPLGCRHP